MSVSQKLGMRAISQEGINCGLLQSVPEVPSLIYFTIKVNRLPAAAQAAASLSAGGDVQNSLFGWEPILDPFVFIHATHEIALRGRRHGRAAPIASFSE